MPSPRSYLLVMTILAALASACGGGESRLGPLKHHLDDMYIAQISLDEKQDIIHAQQDFAIAKMERARAEAEYNESSTDLSLAKDNLQQAALSEKSAKTQKAAAEKSGDMNRINSATLAVRAAELSRKAAAKRLDFVKAHRNYLKQLLFYSEDHAYSQEARYELTKSRLAKRKNISPKGVDLNKFDQQDQARSRYAQRTKVKVDAARNRADDLERQWHALEKEAAQTLKASQPPPTPPPPPSGGEGTVAQ